ncbi:hypothetical protein BN1195_03633 [Chryseobacterium oranimense G311]|uniref:hypothetical protein n=1 Tax=Chryseobacterium oranimense TaxID=421058 RepID=UPI00053393BE|nr:hypothetical protein [Chryseobacterium oranimense]CEJ71288.1 hypothetical protein BN1195_03633 [Chryseobacterium oranimense G311]DAG72848.1 MAG TPA: hypothetical protein [Caudoviricetes sp.]
MESQYTSFKNKFEHLTDSEKLRHDLYSHCRIDNCCNSKGIEYRNITIYWLYDNSPKGVLAVGDCEESVFDDFENEIGSYHTGLLRGEK